MDDRKPLIAGNWKMNHGIAATADVLERLVESDPPDTVDVVVAPPFVSLPAAAMVLAGSPVRLAAQNVHWESSGAYTGEVAPGMLTEVGARWVIVGHSERRAMFGETDETTLQRAAAAQDAGLDVILCIGESLDDREAGRTFDVLNRQTSRLGELEPAHLVVAYEPVWAIGTGRNATPDQAQEAHAWLRERAGGLFGAVAAEQLRILYGGSMKPDNAAELLSQKDVDGGLIGGASLDVDSFFAIIRAAADCAAGEHS